MEGNDLERLGPTVPCELCGQKTLMLGTKRCDRCWELETRIQRDPVLAMRILGRSANAKPCPVTVEKLEDDICLRASIGGKPNEGYYIRYRGDRVEVLNMLAVVAASFAIYQNIPELNVKQNTTFPIGGGN